MMGDSVALVKELVFIVCNCVVIDNAVIVHDVKSTLHIFESKVVATICCDI